jgi:hypothetical protein
MRVPATILTCATVIAAALTGSVSAAEKTADDGSPAHALAQKFYQAAESAQSAAAAKKAEEEAARKEAQRIAEERREAARIKEARREAARIKAAREKAERLEAEKQRDAYEKEMLARARVEAEARRAEQKRLTAERIRKEAEEERLAEQRAKAEAERKKAEAERLKAQAEQKKARLAAEREKARKEAGRIAREAEARRAERQRLAEEERKQEAARLTAEVEAKRRAEEQRRAAQAKRAQAERVAQEAESKRAAEAKQRAATARAALEKRRLEEARRIAKKFREAREVREAKKRAAAETEQATRNSLGGPMPPPETRKASSSRKTVKRRAQPLSTRATVLLLLEPRSSRLDGRKRPANPVLCVGSGCYVSKGPERAADYMGRRKALGPINTMGRRAGPCRRQLTCTFRNVELGVAEATVQPVDMGFWGHRRHDVLAAHPDTTCDITRGELRCSDPIVADSYRAWIVPEEVAAEAGPELLEAALNEGLPATRSASKGEAWWAEVQALPTR